jgi:DNA-binding MarR family transcriptional regulator
VVQPSVDSPSAISEERGASAVSEGERDASTAAEEERAVSAVPEEERDASAVADERDASFVPEEADVLARVAGMPVDHSAMAVVANAWRAAQGIRTYLERSVLRPEGLSFAGFSVLFNLWVWGPMETRALAASMSCSRATVSTVSTTLERAGLVARRGDERDRRLVLLELTPSGRATIEDLYPRFNAGEAALAASLSDQERSTLAELLRRLVLASKEPPGDG